MNYWNQTPLFRLLPAFIFGILAGIVGSYLKPLWILLFSAIPAFLFLSQVLLPKKFFSYRFRWLFGLSAQLLTFSFAWLLTEFKTEIYSQSHFSKYEHVSAYMAYLNDSKQEKSKSYKTTIRIVAVKSGDKWFKVDGKCLVYIFKDSVSAALRYGDLITFTNVPAEVQPPANPSQFNYKKFLSYNQVYHQLYFSSGKYRVVAHHHGSEIVEMAINMREKLLKIFKDNNISGDDYAVVSALLLGDTDEIDQEIMTAYAASGALHVLSVSGLHVGIIYIALNAFLFFLNRNKKTRVMKAGILILFLWYYALLTGLSPAVLRSAAMLSFIVLGKALDRYTNMYNTLAASAIALFCFQPHLLMQVGFQLSYLAVLGIVFLYKKIHLLLNPRNWLLKQIWGLTAVSVAAQLATFPLGLFYFNQFPNYFLLSNLLVIPISTVILYGGIILFIISPLTIFAKWVGLVLGKIVHLLNYTVITIEHLPFALTQGISISILETCILYVSILMLILFFMKKEPKYIMTSILTTIILLSLRAVETIQFQKQQQLIVYDIPKSSAINLINGNSGVFISDSVLVNNRSMMMFNVIHYWWDCGVNEAQTIKVVNGSETLKSKSLFLQKNIVRFQGKTILLMNDSTLLNTSHQLYFDYIILSKNLKIHLKEVVKKFHFKELIIDSSNSNYHVQRWKKEAEKLGIVYYVVADKGAFVKVIE